MQLESCLLQHVCISHKNPSSASVKKSQPQVQAQSCLLPHIVDHLHLHVQAFTPHVTLSAQIVRLLYNFLNWKKKTTFCTKNTGKQKASSMKSKCRKLDIQDTIITITLYQNDYTRESRYLAKPKKLSLQVNIR